MLVIGKYFFGYGSVVLDFYVVLFVDECEFDEICSIDMVVFECLIECVLLDGVMFVYVIYN